MLYLRCFILTQSEHVPAVANLTLLTQSCLCPFPLQGSNAGGGVKNAQFAAEVVRSVGKEKLSLETGGLAAKEEWKGPLNSPLSQPKHHGVFSACLHNESACMSLFSIPHTLFHVPPLSTSPILLLIPTLITTAAKFKFSYPWRTLVSAPGINHLTFFQCNIHYYIKLNTHC